MHNIHMYITYLVYVYILYMHRYIYVIVCELDYGALAVILFAMRWWHRTRYVQLRSIVHEVCSNALKFSLTCRLFFFSICTTSMLNTHSHTHEHTEISKTKHHSTSSTSDCMLVWLLGPTWSRFCFMRHVCVVRVNAYYVQIWKCVSVLYIHIHTGQVLFRTQNTHSLYGFLCFTPLPPCSARSRATFDIQVHTLRTVSHTFSLWLTIIHAIVHQKNYIYILNRRTPDTLHNSVQQDEAVAVGT